MQSTKQLGYNLLSSVGGGILSGDYIIFMHPGNTNIAILRTSKLQGLQSPLLWILFFILNICYSVLQ